MTAPDRGRTAVELDDLRRRLYRAGATQEDLERYLGERAPVVEPEPPRPAPEAPRPRRFLLAGAVAGVLALAVAATGVLLHRPAGAARSPAAATAPPTAEPAVGNGRLLPVEPGRASGPAATAITIDGAATAAERFDGIGTALVSVHLPGSEFGTTRAIIALYSTRTSSIAWRALRRTGAADATASQQVVAQGRIASHVDYADPSAFTYAGAPPTRIAVEAPAGLHWTLLVAADEASSSDLR